MRRSKEELIRFAHDEILAKGNLNAVEEVFADDYVLHAGGKEHRGAAFVRKFIGQLRSAIPDIRLAKLEFLMRSADRVAWQRTFRGTNRAGLKGIPPTGKKVEWTDILVSRFEGGKIAEEWAVSQLAERLLLGQPRP